MEVGAVKQAFNNEIILLNKKLHQAKTHVINKLTRKARTLIEKKSPEHLKEKLKQKATSAVNEVLIIKKIKAREIAKFSITHTGELKDYLNRPKVDNDKACARLLLHKSLQDKCKFIRNKFGNVPINDLFMSRQERRRLKKEAREQQKYNKKGKNGKVDNTEGDWDVEDVEIENDSKDISKNKMDSDGEESNDEGEHAKVENDIVSENENHTDTDEHSKGKKQKDSQSYGQNKDSSDNEPEVGKFVKLKPEKEIKKPVQKAKSPIVKNIGDTAVSKSDIIKLNLSEKPPIYKKIGKKVKENKNKNLNEKLQNRKFKKDVDEGQDQDKKVVDPFFITATGENYMSLAEPRQPDEVKEIHKQGNRKLRRAAMFGHVPKTKPKGNYFSQDKFRSNKFDKQNEFGNDGFTNKYDSSKSGGNNYTFNNRNSRFSDQNANFNDRNDKINDRKFNKNIVAKEEKLHPSWEAKKKLSSILPFQGKKTVFNEN